MTAPLIDGRFYAATYQAQLKEKLKGRSFALHVLLIGNHEPSQIYVAHKKKACEALGLECEVHTFPDTVSFGTLRQCLKGLNEDPGVHGILIQLPLPIHLDSLKVLSLIHPLKDVDGLGPYNMGRLWQGNPLFVPCTPQGCLYLLKEVCPQLEGLQALVIGRSNLVGKPMAALLLQENATVTLAHSKTQNLKELCLQADILVTALGKPKTIPGEWVREGAIVIDVGITRFDGQLMGDVDFEAARQRASFITPVPGGVGPMTIACLLANVIKAGELQAIEKPLS